MAKICELLGDSVQMSLFVLFGIINLPIQILLEVSYKCRQMSGISDLAKLGNMIFFGWILEGNVLLRGKSS